VSKCEIPKPEKRHITRSVRYWDFGYWEMEMLQTHIIRSHKVPKCQNPKKVHRLEYWIPGFRIPGVGGVKSKDSSSEESQNREI
jgi:hypothetical protein